MTVDMDDMYEFGDDTPRPIDMDAAGEGAFERLGEGQGAVVAKRREVGPDGRTPQDAGQPLGRRTLIVVAVAGILATAIIAVGLARMLTAPAPVAEEPVEVEQTAVAADQGIQSRGSLYELVQGDKGYQLVERHGGEEGQATVLGDLEGTPAALVLYDGALIVPQTMADGTWNVMAYTIGVGWSKMAKQDGTSIGGKGSATAAELDGNVLMVTVDGAPVEVPLTW